MEKIKSLFGKNQNHIKNKNKIIKSIEEINRKIKNGSVKVFTAEEFKNKFSDVPEEEIIKKVDIVTTATYGPMCSSGIFLNFGHAQPPIRMEKVRLNNVEAYSGIAAVDTYLGATQQAGGSDHYGGAHVIKELAEGKEVNLEAWGKGTDCYPRKHIRTRINKNSVNEIYFFNPRNVYQNYPAAINMSNKPLYTYMGRLHPLGKNINFSTTGDISPLFNDPFLETLGIGSRIYFAGGMGYIAWTGTQFNPYKEINEYGIPIGNARSLALICDLKEIDPDLIQPIVLKNYGISLSIGIGIPIPVISLSIAGKLKISNNQIHTVVCDYSVPQHPVIEKVSYSQLYTGQIETKYIRAKTFPLSNRYKALKICCQLKEKIINGNYSLSPFTNFKQNIPEQNQLKETGFHIPDIASGKGKIYD